MRITTGHAITAELKAASDAIKLCGDYSIANPKVSVKDNPHTKAADKAHRKATGSINVFWGCSCGSIDPYINDDMATVCCGEKTVSFYDHRRRR